MLCTRVHSSAGVLLLIWLMAIPVSPARAEIIYQHLGSSDPAAESWGVSQSANTWAGPVVDGGIAAWKVRDYGSGWGEMCYYYASTSASDYQQAAGWSLEARVRVLAAPSMQGGYPGGDVFLVTDDGTSYWMLSLVGADPNPGNNGIWYYTPGGDYDLHQLYQMDTSSAYHTYSVVYDPTAADRVGVYVDNSHIGDLLRSQVHASFGSPDIWWGAGSQVRTSESNWAMVAFDNGAPPAVPEPRAFALLAAGVAIIACHRKRRK